MEERSGASGPIPTWGGSRNGERMEGLFVYQRGNTGAHEKGAAWACSHRSLGPEAERHVPPDDVAVVLAVPDHARAFRSVAWPLTSRCLRATTLVRSFALSRSPRRATGTVGSEEARLRAGLRPPPKLHVRFSRMQFSRQCAARGSNRRYQSDQVHQSILAVQHARRQPFPSRRCASA